MKRALALIAFVIGLFGPALVLVYLGVDRFEVGLAWGIIWTSLFATRLFDIFEEWGMMP